MFGRHHMRRGEGHGERPQRGLGGEGFEGRGEGRGQGRSRRGRVFDQGDLRFVILKLISEKPSHGYELIKEIEDRLGGAYSPSPGVVYPTLTFLEEAGYIAAAASEGAKKAYAITDEGLTALEQNRPLVEGLFQRIAGLAQRSQGGRAPQIVRAISNLHVALRLRMERGDVSQAQIGAIAEVLDGAARAIEAA